jgi:hypothetical protein
MKKDPEWLVDYRNALSTLSTIGLLDEAINTAVKLAVCSEHDFISKKAAIKSNAAYSTMVERLRLEAGRVTYAD